MLPTINLTSNRSFKIRNFEEDRIATLHAHPGLRYNGIVNSFYKFSGDFYLTNLNGELIETFEIALLIGKSYPNIFPLLFLLDEKIEKSDGYHIDEFGCICLEHTYIANALAKSSLRIYDFINYYLPKYFSWALLKKHSKTESLQEWEHKDKGTKQVYEILLETTDSNIIKLFLENYCIASEIRRNDKCYCGNDRKLKNCHYEAVLFLKNTPKEYISKDISLFEERKF
jgi:hypothetical protein